MANDADAFRTYMDSSGIKGILTLMACSYLQVIAAVIPAGPFELAAGYSFGILKGALICDLAMTLGSATVFILVKIFGQKFIDLFISEKQLEAVRFLKVFKDPEKTAFIYFLIFLIPGTPKDIISYTVGLTKMNFWVWIFITFVGRFPSIILTAAGGGAVLSRNYYLLIAVVILFIVVTVLGSRWYRKWKQKHSEESQKS